MTAYRKYRNFAKAINMLPVDLEHFMMVYHDKIKKVLPVEEWISKMEYLEGKKPQNAPEEAAAPETGESIT